MTTFIKTRSLTVNLDCLVRIAPKQTNPPEGEDRKYFLAFVGRENVSDKASRDAGNCITTDYYDTPEKMLAAYNRLMEDINQPWVGQDRVIHLS